MSGVPSAEANRSRIHRQILLRKLIRDEVQAGKSDKEIFKKSEEDFGDTVLYAPRFDRQTAALRLSPFIVAKAAAGVWAYQRHRRKTNVHIMARNLPRGVPLTPLEKETMLNLLTPHPRQGEDCGGEASDSPLFRLSVTPAFFLRVALGHFVVILDGRDNHITK